MSIKKFFLGILCAFAVVAQAQQTAVLNKALTPGTNSVYGLKAHVVGLTLLSTVSGNVSFYDNSTNSITYTNAAYTRYVSYATNFTQLYTNTQGIIQTNYYVGQYRAPVSVAAATNTSPVLQTVYFEANVPQALSVEWLAVKGISAVASTNVSITMTYGTLP